MIIVGERINGSRTRVREAVLAREADFIAEEAMRQAEAGADYLDLNAGTEPEREPEDMVWLVRTVQEVVDRPLSIDSANVAALSAGLEACGPRERSGFEMRDAGEPPTLDSRLSTLDSRPLVNSASAESGRMEAVLGLVAQYGARVVGLTLDDAGLPKTAEQRVAIASRLAKRAEELGIARGDIFIDPLARAVAVENEQGAAFLDSVAGIREALPGIHVICGLSNISFQMPARRLLNRTFLAMAMARGMDAAIVDPLDGGLMAAICAAKALLGQDEMCLGFIQAHRAGKLAQWT
jgi:5-methyltetrahydrofolate--homocysteine methyltransferase